MDMEHTMLPLSKFNYNNGVLVVNLNLLLEIIHYITIVLKEGEII